MAHQLADKAFSNSFVDELPGESSFDIRSRMVPNACYSRVAPSATADPKLVAWSEELAASFGVCLSSEDPSSTDILSGNSITPSMKPYAARYGGHQFGSWAGQLGDGRAITLGELEDSAGRKQELQLKGAGRTPYSRHADGRAVLRSSIREFLCSEAMHYLGIPTTRALSIATTGDLVTRDMFYDGNPYPEIGAVVCRVAPSFIRFGNFEIFYAEKELDNLGSLARYVRHHLFPECSTDGEWFREVSIRTARLIAEWRRVGFVHGVMNTDNMSILGITIDYGPYGWLERFDPTWTPNTTDFTSRRYRFEMQPQIGLWNVVCLANALTPLVPMGELEAGLKAYQDEFAAYDLMLQRRKLGLMGGADEEAQRLIEDLYAQLQLNGLDLTVFFRLLSENLLEVVSTDQVGTFKSLLEKSSYLPIETVREPFEAWLRAYRTALRSQERPLRVSREEMLSVNPSFVLRNHLVHSATAKAIKGDYSGVFKLSRALKTPYATSDDFPSERSPNWAFTTPGCSTLSCSS